MKILLRVMLIICFGALTFFAEENYSSSNIDICVVTHSVDSPLFVCEGKTKDVVVKFYKKVGTGAPVLFKTTTYQMEGNGVDAPADKTFNAEVYECNKTWKFPITYKVTSSSEWATIRSGNPSLTSDAALPGNLSPGWSEYISAFELGKFQFVRYYDQLVTKTNNKIPTTWVTTNICGGKITIAELVASGWEIGVKGGFEYLVPGIGEKVTCAIGFNYKEVSSVVTSRDFKTDKHHTRVRLIHNKTIWTWDAASGQTLADGSRFPFQPTKKILSSYFSDDSAGFEEQIKCCE